MKISELIRKLKQGGCYFISHGGNHDWWFSPKTNMRFQVPRHGSQDVKSKLKESIERFSGIKL